eukprot:Phypoly_transcript_10633.p1 GENE.Phypoly_transcript_10633~~Phypoly_transcript_10633.p1  ORF type:complete len:321 (+),score=47.48 Phypoly_transcript_10633:81-1043(+)
MTPLVWFSLLAGTAPLIAATIPFYLFKNGINPRTFQLLLGVSAGLLFAIATLELIPEAFEMIELSAQPKEIQMQSRDSRHLLFSHKLLATDDDSPYPTVETQDEVGGHEHEEGKGKIPMLGLGAGFVFLIILEQFMSGNGHSHSHSHVANKHDDEEEAQDKQNVAGLSSSLSMVAFVGLSFHSLVDGIIIAGAFTASPETGSRVALAILLHKFPDGFVMSSIVASQHAKNPSMHRLAYIAAIAGMTPTGALIGSLLLGGIPPVAVGFVLGFGAGTFLYITATGILPELTHAKGVDKTLSIAAIVVGYLAFLFIDTQMHAH